MARRRRRRRKSNGGLIGLIFSILELMIVIGLFPFMFVIHAMSGQAYASFTGKATKYKHRVR